MSKKFDALIIGTGPTGSTVTDRLATLGWKVAVVDVDGYGGTCPLRGCIPKKVMASVTELVGITNKMQNTGLVATAKIDWKQLVDYKNSFIENTSKNSIAKFQGKGVTTLHGFAKFIDEKTIEVDGEHYESEKIIIATGAKPFELPIEGKEHLKYSDDFLDMETLPKRILFIGGGYISLEFAHIAARSGAHIDVLQRGDRILEGFEPELVDLLQEESKKVGIDIHTNASVEKVEKTNAIYTVTAKASDGSTKTWETDCVINCTGRVPAVDGLDLEKGNIKFDKAGVKVNPFLQSMTNPRVYAGGDVAATKGVQLTPVANLDGQTIVENIIKGNELKVDYSNIPSVAFTLPKLGTVGMSIEEAKETGHKITIHDLDMSEWFSFKVMQEENVKIKLIIDVDEDIILGAHMLGDQADDLINLLALCCQMKLNVNDLKKLTFVFPSTINEIKKVL